MLAAASVLANVKVLHESFYMMGKGAVSRATLYEDNSCKFLNLCFESTVNSPYLEQWYLNEGSCVKGYCSDWFPILSYISNSIISNYWYLQVNFLGQKNYFEISVVWDEFWLWDMESWLYLKANWDFILVGLLWSVSVVASGSWWPIFWKSWNNLS